MTFKDVCAAGQLFSEQPEMMGEEFIYQGAILRGVFDQVALDWTFADFSFRKVTALICVTSKAQWAAAAKVPANREEIIFMGKAYPIQAIAGESDKEPAFTLTLFQLT